MSLWQQALGDSGCDYLGDAERRTYSDAPTVREVQSRMAAVADQALHGTNNRAFIAFDPGPIDGVIRPQLTNAIIAAQKFDHHQWTDGKIDDWLISHLGMQPHGRDPGTPAPSEIPNPATTGSSGKKKKVKVTTNYVRTRSEGELPDGWIEPDFDAPVPSSPAAAAAGPAKASTFSLDSMGTVGKVAAALVLGYGVRRLLKRS